MSVFMRTMTDFGYWPGINWSENEPLGADFTLERKVAQLKRDFAMSVIVDIGLFVFRRSFNKRDWPFL